MNGFVTLLLLAVCILLHEFGHYLSAKSKGIAVSEFFIGFGPKIYSFNKNNTEYGIKAFLLGGYVKIPGMDKDEEVTGYKEDELFHTTKWQNKLLISSSGIVVNLFLAFIILLVVLSTVGISYPILEIDSLGESVSERTNAPSFEAGLQPGDIFLSFNGVQLNDWDQLVDLIENSPSENVKIKYIRNEKIYTTTAYLDERVVDNSKSGYLGVSPKIKKDSLSVLKVITNSFVVLFNMISSSISGIFTLFNPINLYTLAGGLFGNDVPAEIRPLSPIGLAQAGQAIGNAGFMNVLFLLAFVNVFLAVFNSIPIIPLDGGRIVFSLIEGLTGKKVSDKKLIPLATLVVLLFIFLGITALYLDITQPIKL